MLAELSKMAANYSLVKPKDFSGIVNFCIGQNKFICTMTEDSVKIEEGYSDQQLLDFLMEPETFEKLKNGTWTALTAAGREDMRQSAPLDFKLGAAQKLSAEILHLTYHLGTHFFTLEYPQVIRFGPDNTRLVHGGNAAALAYGYGVRFAYYTITGDEQINREEDKNPFYQLVCIINGRGTAWVAGKEILLEKGIAIYVPINETHIFRAAEGHHLELFILMYGPGA